MVSSVAQPVLSCYSRHEVETCMVHMQDPRNPCAERETLRIRDWLSDDLNITKARARLRIHDWVSERMPGLLGASDGSQAYRGKRLKPYIT